MTGIQRFIFLTVFPILALTGAGCKQIQPGYYLTPGNYPTSGIYPTLPPTAPPTQAPVMLSVTPPSTIRSPDPLTPTQTPSSTPTPTPTETPFKCAEAQGEMVFASFVSSFTGQEFHYRVHLPPCYAATGRRYPTLFMLHGLVPGTDVMNDDQWDRLGLDEAADQGYLDRGLPPMIIVMPNGNDARHGDDDSPFSKVIVSELIPDVEARFCTWNESRMRAIGGLSRGGFWAYSVAFQHPDLFDRVGGHSPFFYDGDYKVYNPYNLLDTAQGIERLVMYIDYGADDHNVDTGIGLFVDKLRSRGIEPLLVINPVGAHVEDYWAAHVADYLSFYSATWPRSVEELPSCHEPSP